MSGWIKKEVEKIRAASERDEKARKWALFSSERVQEKWQEQWKAILEAIRLDIAEFNDSFADEPQRHIECDISGRELRVTRRGADTQVLQMSASASGAAGSLIVSRSNGMQQKRDLRFIWEVDDTGAVGLGKTSGRVDSPGDSSKAILSSLF
jgi:hypothetical protein